MGRHIFKRGARWTYKRRVPTDVRDAFGAEFHQLSLRTKNEAEALSKAADIDRQIESHWDDLRAARRSSASERMRAIQSIARRMGFDYVPAATLAAQASDDEILRRLSFLDSVTPEEEAPGEDVAAAVLGLAEAPQLMLSEVAEARFALEPDIEAGKSKDQIRRRRNPIIAEVRFLIGEVGDKPLAELTRTDMLRYRDAKWARVNTGPTRVKGMIDVDSANRQITSLASTLRVVAKQHSIEIPDVGSLYFKASRKRKKRAPIPRETIAALLSGGRIHEIPGEAHRDFLAMAIYTGARFSELKGLLPGEIVLTGDQPHLIIQPNAVRQLKTDHSERTFPLIGSALEIMRRRREGFVEFRTVADPMANVNDRLRARGIFGAGVTAYGSRHAFQDMLREATEDEQMRCALMGHEYRGQIEYGAGYSLAQKAAVLARLPLPDMAPAP